MCIIAIKNVGVRMPDDETITTMWKNDPDGAGFMYAKDGSVSIEKGFMELDRILDRLHSLAASMDVTATPFVLHFRIATHGGIRPENCHPFPVSGSVAALQRLSVTTDLGVAHNGTIPIAPRHGISDTMEYIVSQLARIKQGDARFFEDKDCMQRIENAIQSRMVLLASDGTVYTIGLFEQHGGMLYSNRRYLSRVSRSVYGTPVA